MHLLTINEAKMCKNVSNGVNNSNIIIKRVWTFK